MRRRAVAVLVLALVAGGLFAVSAAPASAVVTCAVPSVSYPTIQSAVNDPTCDEIDVAAGTYIEQVTINRTVTLKGAQAGVDARTRSGAESIITNACGPVQIEADTVVIDGFTIEGSTLPDPCFLAGIWTNPGFSGTQGGHTIVNNIVQNNISGIELDSTCSAAPTLVQHNLIQNNNNPGPGSGNGIQTNFGLCNATIDANKFSGHSNSSVLISSGNDSGITVSNNTLVGGTPERIIFGGVTNGVISGNVSNGSTSSGVVRLFGGDTNIAVTGNVLLNGVRGIFVDNQFAPNSGVTAHQNCISGNTTAGLEEGAGGHTGTLDATNNWWGSPTGPTIASNPGGTGDKIIDADGVVTYKPFLTSPPAAPCPGPAPACVSRSSISSNFNGTAIPAGRTIWFNAVLKASGLPTTGTTTVDFTNVMITFSDGTTNYVVPVPDAHVVYSSATTTASTTFSGSHMTQVPIGFGQNAFLDGKIYLVPPPGLKGGIKNVTWSGTFSTSTPGVNLQWKWGAAVYTSFPNDPNYNAVGIKPVDGAAQNPYANSDHAGTPENVKQFVTGGATGGGGSNYTGSYSGTAAVPCRAP